jgi:glycosyltransferase involved in cell wall biosynthesis
MRILIASPYLPWPLRSGGNAAQFSTLKCLSADHEFTLVCPIYDSSQEEDARQLAQEVPEVRVRAVWCGSVRAGKSSATLADPLVLRLLRPLLRDVRRILRPTAREVETNDTPPQLPYDPLFFLPRPYVEALSIELEHGVDLVQAEFAEMLSLGPWLPAGIPKLFVHHQIHFVYAQRFMATGSDGSFANYVTEFTRSRELACLRAFDGIATFSDADRDCLTLQPDMPPVFTSPFPVPADVGFAAAPAGGFSGSFSFLGSEEHFPNCDALEWLLERIWPAILRELPDAKLLVIGQWSETWKARAAVYGQPVGFTGFVPDLGAALRGGIQLVPLRIGSGIRTKILAALAQGVPCVATTIAAEGLQLGQQGGVVIEDDETRFVDGAIRLARNQTEWQARAAEGLMTVSKNYTPEAVRSRRNEVYAKVLARYHANPHP